MRQLCTGGMILGCLLAAWPLPADDWPQWMGPQRDNVWRETGIVESIPAGGLPVVWRTPVEGGYSGPAIANGRVFVMDYVRTAGDAKNDPNTRATLQGTERVLCLSEKDGQILWKHEYDCPYDISYPAGPRCTPTVDGDLVYTLGAEGNLLCLDAATGAVKWSKQFQKDYGAKAPHWGHSAHPLVYGDLLICVVGGEGSVAVAFDKKTGEEKWKALSAKEQGYCPPTIIHYADRDELLIWDAERLNGMNPLTGELLWSHDIPSGFGMAIMAPQLAGDQLFASAIGPAGGLFRLRDSDPKIEPVWLGTPKTGVSCANSTPFLQDGVIYGVDCRSGGLRAVDIKDGAWLWETYAPTTGDHRAGHGTAFLVKQGDRFWLFSETGDLILAKLSPEKYEELGRTHVLEPTGEAFGRSVVWTAPAFANGCCFVRNDKEVVCVSLKK
ncbi:PQQ-binding-like beta-propeller repeat protein [Planctomicrobium piriforme]|uniref:Outer membrane protein assembly factor BamB, contains PQQ-like beta-propeller repeat n=1 Tax=Planctomicrobium piriforme TaxID=1576369 RepID=A0A1I3QAY9_9PLAN|nr:PQQ-binding-like beta-propeller repeat protein [Planctomicrobium piriforme]SFJ31444.1 Outer membrane protein assembly factor BamB, contains PQQ-like beta-propeller repeat [Planctomicrobium piriforme]